MENHATDRDLAGKRRCAWCQGAGEQMYFILRVQGLGAPLHSYYLCGPCLDQAASLVKNAAQPAPPPTKGTPADRAEYWRQRRLRIAAAKEAGEILHQQLDEETRARVNEQRRMRRQALNEQGLTVRGTPLTDAPGERLLAKLQQEAHAHAPK